METKHKPILTYLVAQNELASTSCSYTIDEIALKLAEIMLSAKATIVRGYRRHKMLKYRKQNMFLADIYFDEKLQDDTEVFLIGEFTPHTWVDKVQMKYSHAFKEYKAQVLIKENANFQFLVRGAYKLNKDYKITTQEFGESFNEFFINKSGSYKPVYEKKLRAPKTSLFPKQESFTTFFEPNFEEEVRTPTFQNRNSQGGSL